MALLALSAIVLMVIGGMVIKKNLGDIYETVSVTEIPGAGQVKGDPGQTKSLVETETLAESESLEESTGDVGMGDGETQEEETQESRPVLMFAGDVLLSDHVLGAYNKAGNIRGVLGESLLEKIRAADLFVVNQEFPFSNRGSAAADKQYTFRLPPERVSLLTDMGIDLVTLANNHSLDFGKEALLDTLDTLDQAGLPHVGAGRNLEEAKAAVILEVGGKTIGFLGASRVIPEGSWNAGAGTPGLLTTYDPAVLVGEIKKIRESCDYVVVYVHWGIERDERPQEYQRTLGKQYIDAGADLVIGSHPHVLQGIEYYQGKPIVYSLGNFVFGSSIKRTALLKVDLNEELTLSLIPGRSSGGYTTQITDEGEILEFYRYMEGISYGITIRDGVVTAQP